MATLYTASHVKDATGLSYRQLNEWDRRGALPETREGDASWRRFSPRDFFVLLVCAELRKRFPVPLEQIKYVKDFMLQDGADHFRAAVELMVRGFNVLLLTDFATTFAMDTDVEIGELLYLGMTRDNDPAAFVILKINPLVNRMLACRTEPIELKIKDTVYDVIYAAKGLMLQNREEQDLIQLIRSGDYSKIIIRMISGEIVRVDAESEHGAMDDEHLAEFVRQQDFQTVSVTTQNGKIVRVTRTSPNVTVGTRKRQETPERRDPPKAK